MFYFYKIIISAIVITAVSEIAKKYSSAGGLIAAMPITTLLTLFWLNHETGDLHLLKDFTVSVFWGIFPSLLFFLAAIFFFKKGWGFYSTMGISLLILLVGVILHRKFIPN